MVGSQSAHSYPPASHEAHDVAEYEHRGVHYAYAELEADGILYLFGQTRSPQWFKAGENRHELTLETSSVILVGNSAGDILSNQATSRESTEGRVDFAMCVTR